MKHEVNQKLISFKVDKDTLEALDMVVSRCDGRLINGKPARVNRNKFINMAVFFAVEAVEGQLEVLDKFNKSELMPNFI